MRANDRRSSVRARGALLSVIDADRAVSLQYDPLSWLTPDELLTSLFMTAGPRSRQPFREDSTLFGPFDLPSGRYELRLFRTNARDPMPVSVVYHLRRMRGTLAAAPNGAGNLIVLPFDVPVDLDGVWARVPGDGATVARGWPALVRLAAAGAGAFLLATALLWPYRQLRVEEGVGPSVATGTNAPWRSSRPTNSRPRPGSR